MSLLLHALKLENMNTEKKKTENRNRKKSELSFACNQKLTKELLDFF